MIKRRVNTRKILGKIGLLFLALVLCLSPTPAAAKLYTRYVDADIADKNSASATGDCPNPGTYDHTSERCGGGTDTVYATYKDVNAFLKTLSDGDSATVYWNRGDVWTIDSTETYAAIVISEGNVVFDDYGSGNKPILDGNWYDDTDGDGVHANDRFNSAIELTSYTDTFSIYDMEIKRFWGSGIAIGGYNSRGGEIKRCYIHDMGRVFVNIKNTPNYTIEENTFEVAEEFYRKYGDNNDFGNPALVEQGNWGQGIQSPGSNAIIRYNRIGKSYGECIGAGTGPIEYNVVYDCRSTALYASPHNTNGINFTFRYNLVFCTNDPTYRKTDRMGRNWCGDGININDETTEGATGGTKEIIGNIVIACYTGIRIKNDADNNVGTVLVYQNTLIDNGYNFVAQIEEGEANDIHIKDNLSVVYNDAKCDHTAVWKSIPTSIWRVGPNHWSSKPENSEFSSNNDEISDPNLPKETGWHEVRGSSYLSYEDFYPNSSYVYSDKTLRDNHAIIFDKVVQGTDPAEGNLFAPSNLRISMGSN